MSDYNRPNYPDKRTPLRSIRYFCLDCMSGQQVLVKDCPDGACALHPYRGGKNPARTGHGGNTDALQKYREGRVVPVKERSEST